MAQAMMAGAALGGIVSSYQQFRAGDIERKLSNQSALAMEHDAGEVLRASQEDARVKRREGRMMVSSQQANYASSGVALEGSPLLVMQETRELNELDAMKIEYGGALQAKRLRDEAALARYRGKVAYQSGMLGAGSTLLTTGFNVGGAMHTNARMDALYNKQMSYYSKR